MKFFEQLSNSIKKSNSRLCLGIDPQIPAASRLAASAKSGISVLNDIVGVLVSQAVAHDLPAVKFQSAYFEAHGIEGLRLLQHSITRLKSSNIMCILDAKRGDISSTMHAYGCSAFDWMDADCLTINPYMGVDTIEPLLPWLKKGKGVYVVWLTSNKSANELQFLKMASQATFVSEVYAVFSRFSKENLVESSVGYVLGATKIAQPEVRKLLAAIPRSAFLMPGVGAQGAVIDEEMKLFLSNHPASLVPVSREIGGIAVSVNSVAEYEQQVSTAIQRFKTQLAVT